MIRSFNDPLILQHDLYSKSTQDTAFFFFISSHLTNENGKCNIFKIICNGDKIIQKSSNNNVDNTQNVHFPPLKPLKKISAQMHPNADICTQNDIVAPVYLLLVQL